MTEKKTTNPVLPDPRTDEDWAAIQKACKEDPHYIHPKEAQALKELKEKFSDVSLHSFWDRFPKDKACYAFLFARKLDVARTASVMKEHMQWRRDHCYLEGVRLSQLDPKMMQSAFAYHTPGKRDSHGRLISYIFMARFKPKEYSKGAMNKVQIWTFDHMLKTEPIDAFRFGFTYVEDLAGAGLSNIQNDKAEQKQMMQMLEIFPLRIRSILVVDPGIILRTFLRIAKFFVKKKILQRVECVKRVDLLDRIPADSLITEFGGNYKFDFSAYMAEQLRNENNEAKQAEQETSLSSSFSSSSSKTTTATSTTETDTTDIDADYPTANDAK